MDNKGHFTTATQLLTRCLITLALLPMMAGPASSQPAIANQCRLPGSSCQNTQNDACFNIHKDLTVTETSAGKISFYTDGFQLGGYGLHAIGQPVDQKGTAIAVRGETSVVPIGQPQSGAALGELGISSGFFNRGRFDGARGFSFPEALSNFDENSVGSGAGGFFRSEALEPLSLSGIGTYWVAGSYNEIRGEVNGSAGLGQVAAVIGIDNLDTASTAPHYAGFFDGTVRVTDLPNDESLTKVVVADHDGLLHYRDANLLAPTTSEWEMVSSSLAPDSFASTRTATVSCPAGMRALSGGVKSVGGDTRRIVGNHPTASGNGWTGEVAKSDPGDSLGLDVWVVCGQI